MSIINIIIVWYCIGLLIFSCINRIDLKRGNNFSVEGLLITLVFSCLGPILLIVAIQLYPEFFEPLHKKIKPILSYKICISKKEK